MDPTANSTNTGAAQNAQTGSGGEQGKDGTEPQSINMNARVFMVNDTVDFLKILAELMAPKKEEPPADINTILSYISNNHEAYKEKMGTERWQKHIVNQLGEVVSNLRDADVCQCDNCIARRKEQAKMD
jgi:hypothetical protein